MLVDEFDQVDRDNSEGFLTEKNSAITPKLREAGRGETKQMV